MARLIERGLDAIEAVARRGTSSLAELSSDCRIPMSTAQRIVTSLIERGYLIAEQRGRYRLGTQCISIARTISFPTLLAQNSRRPLDDLAR